MSSTINFQNLLVNVFRPTYVYDVNATLFRAQLDISNVNTVFANVFSGLRADIGDQSNNVYLGVGSGNPIDLVSTAGNSNNTFVGFNAGTNSSNVTNSIYMGYTAGQFASNADGTIAIGVNTFGNGNRNIVLGNNSGVSASGNDNILIGNNTTVDNNRNNLFFIASGTATYISGRVDVSGAHVSLLGEGENTPWPIEMGDYTYVSNGLGINADPAQHTLNVNGDCRMEDGFGLFQFDQNQTSSNSIFSVESYTPGKILEATFGSVTNDASVNVFGQVGATKGFYSKQSITKSLNNGDTEIIDTVAQSGLVMVTVVCPASASAYFWGNWVYNGTTLTQVAGAPPGQIAVAASGSDLVLSNTSAGAQKFNYNITYFPTP